MLSRVSMLSRLQNLPLKRILPVIGFAITGVIGLVWMLSGKNTADITRAQTNPDRPVQVQTVTFSAATSAQMLVGTVRARFEGDQGFRLNGKIATRAVQLGDRVKAGTVLATLDLTDLRLQRETAEAELAAANASEKQTELERDRILELRRKGWSTEQQSERQRATLEEAAGRRKRAERQVELARNAQSYGELKAEADGTIIGVSAEAGQVVAAGQPVIRLARDGEREAQISIPEQDLASARSSTAEAVLWSIPDQRFKAKLRELSPNADAATRTFQARFTILDLAPDAPLGMTVTLHLAGKDTARLARIPISAILNEGGGTEVFVVDPANQQLTRRAVTVLSYDAREALVSTGLNENDLVVTLGVHKLRVGQKVRTLPDTKRN